MATQHDERLQRYFDGELTPEERARFEAEMTDEDRERLAALAELRALVSGALDGEAGELDLWSAIEGQVGAVPGVVPIDSARMKGAAQPKRRLFGRGLFGTGAGLLVAAAAALLLFMYPRHTSRLPTNGCDVESLEVAGAVATVIQVADDARQDDQTTIIWTEDK